MEVSGYVLGASELINVREFVQKWDSTVIPGLSDIDKKNTPHKTLISQELDVDSSTIAELETVCRFAKGDNF